MTAVTLHEKRTVQRYTNETPWNTSRQSVLCDQVRCREHSVPELTIIGILILYCPIAMPEFEGVPGERWILTSLWKTAWPNSSSRVSGFERPMKHRISFTNRGKLVVAI